MRVEFLRIISDMKAELAVHRVEIDMLKMGLTEQRAFQAEVRSANATMLTAITTLQVLTAGKADKGSD